MSFSWLSNSTVHLQLVCQGSLFVDSILLKMSSFPLFGQHCSNLTGKRNNSERLIRNKKATSGWQTYWASHVIIESIVKV